jgi:hypothetical protein
VPVWYCRWLSGPSSWPSNRYVLVILYLLSTFYGETRNPPVTGPPKPIHVTACSLVTRAEVEQAIARVVNEGTEEIDGQASTCDYATKTGLVSITLQRLTTKPNLPREIGALKKEVPEGNVREAPGFSEAFYFDVPDAGTQLHIINVSNGGSTHLMISILGFGDASEVSGAAAQIARKAMSRL